MKQSETNRAEKQICERLFSKYVALTRASESAMTRHSVLLCAAISGGRGKLRRLAKSAWQAAELNMLIKADGLIERKKTSVAANAYKSWLRNAVIGTRQLGINLGED
jgi:hypothetical protein